MKAILVIDEMPTRCLGCPCYYEDKGRCQNTWESVEDDLARPSWCPLRPLPQKIEVDVKKIEDIMNTEFQMIDVIQDKIKAKIKLDTDKLIALGWNDCLDEILGGEQE